ncbi:MAG: SpoIID/LytB domain-containing protein [Deltaproteobacteria bacterium]|nr:SpoIID/LytB domain-containing protein [Deltaproteobacteria bacterium]
MKLQVLFRGVFFFLFIIATACATTSKEVTLQSSPEGPALQEEPMVRVFVSRRRRGGILKLPMETYLAGVIGSEMSSRWPKEALKAQAVAARSYALYRMQENRKEGRKFDLVATQADQVFRHGTSKNPYLQEIVESTRGQVLMKDGKVVEAFYSSTCGGQLRSALMAGLSASSPLTRCLTDSYCKVSPFRNWMVRTHVTEIEKKLKRKGIRVKDLQTVEVADRDGAGYVSKVALIDSRGRRTTISGDRFRYAFGSMQVKSTLFTLTHHSPTVDIAGRGFGHGVGMCQYGAKQMAQKKRGYRGILSKYYPGISVQKIY